MPTSVLIVEDRRDVLELNRILLSAEGYETDGCSYAEATPERLRHNAPDVILLDLVPNNEAPWALLKRLRQDEFTHDLGVVVTSDAPALVERALLDAQYGVDAGLVMPFDIEALYDAIAAAARHDREVRAAGSSVPLLQRAAATLRQNRGRLLMRWAQSLSTLDAFRLHPDLTLAELEGRGDTLIDGVADALALQASSLGAPAADAGISVAAARDHAHLRGAQGFGPSDVAREMAALRREVWREVRDEIARAKPPLEDVWGLQSRVQIALDESLFAMLDTLQESRTKTP